MTDMTPTVVTVSTTSGSGGSGIVEPGKRPIFIKAVKPLVIIAVRVSKTYLDALLGFLTAGAVPVVREAMGAHDFFGVFGMCASLAVAPAVVSLLRNVYELLTKFDQSNPTLSV